MKALSEQRKENKVYKHALSKLMEDPEVGWNEVVRANYRKMNKIDNQEQNLTLEWHWKNLPRLRKDNTNMYNAQMRAFLAQRMTQGHMVRRFYKKPSIIADMTRKGMMWGKQGLLMANKYGVPQLLLGQTLPPLLSIPLIVGTNVAAHYIDMVDKYGSWEEFFDWYDFIMNLSPASILEWQKGPSRMERIRDHFRDSEHNITELWWWVDNGMIDLCKVLLCHQHKIDWPIVQTVTEIIDNNRIEMTKDQSETIEEYKRRTNLSECPFKNPQEIIEGFRAFNVYTPICQALYQREQNEFDQCPEQCKNVFFGGDSINIVGRITFLNSCPKYTNTSCNCTQFPNASGSCPPCINIVDEEQEEDRTMKDDSKYKEYNEMINNVNLYVVELVLKGVSTGVVVGISYKIWCILSAPVDEFLVNLLTPSHVLVMPQQTITQQLVGYGFGMMFQLQSMVASAFTSALYFVFGRRRAPHTARFLSTGRPSRWDS